MPPISPLLPNELLSHIASYLPLPHRIATFSRLSHASHSYLCNASPIAPSIDVIFWDAPYASTYASFLSTMHTRMQLSQMALIYVSLLHRGLPVHRLNIYDSHKENAPLEQFKALIAANLKVLAISWNHAFRLNNSHPMSSPELDWFAQCVPRLEVFVQRHSFGQSNIMVPFWEKVSAMHKLRELSVHLSFEKCNTLREFVNETDPDLLARVTELRMYPRDECYAELVHFKRLRCLRVPTCYRDRPKPFKSFVAKFDLVRRREGEPLFTKEGVDSQRDEHAASSAELSQSAPQQGTTTSPADPHFTHDIDIILDVSHPWPFKLYELAEYLHIFPHVDRNRIKLCYLNEKPLPVPSMHSLKDELIQNVPVTSVVAEMIQQLECIKERYLEHEKRVFSEALCHGLVVNSTGRCPSPESPSGSRQSPSKAPSQQLALPWDENSPECFRRMVLYVRQQNRIHSVWPCMVQYFSRSFDCNVSESSSTEGGLDGATSIVEEAALRRNFSCSVS